jgi:uncharacterized protein (TIGR00369 family)
MPLTPSDPAWRDVALRTFSTAPFVSHLGIELVELAPGRCDARMVLAPEHLQQDGVAHAGVVTTLLDHAAGTAAATLMPAGQRVVSIEFKVHLLRAAVGPELQVSAEVLKPGRSFAVVEAVVTDGGKVVTKLVGTMAYVAPRGS